MNFKMAIILGLLPMFQFAYWNNGYAGVRDQAYYINLGVEAEYEGFFAGGYYQSTFYRSMGYGFSMDNDIFEFNAGFRSGGVEIGFKHNCSTNGCLYLDASGGCFLSGGCVE